MIVYFFGRQEVRDKYVRDQGMLGTKCKFASSGNNFVTYVGDGQPIFQRISLSPTAHFTCSQLYCFEQLKS